MSDLLSRRLAQLGEPANLSLLGECLHGIERECLRVDRDGQLALTPHPQALGSALTHSQITTDYSESLLEFITSGPVVAAILEGPRAVAAFRQLAGGTDPVEKATPGTIRGDLGLETQFNLVHGSDSPDSAVREIELWFPGR